jgi:hypothetical protein
LESIGSSVSRQYFISFVRHGHIVFSFLNRLDQANNEAEKKFDATRLMQHTSARKFWGKHFGSDQHEVAWPRFEISLKGTLELYIFAV